MGLYDRDYMRWTDDERSRYLGGRAAAPRAGSQPAVLFGVLGMLVASATGAHFGFGVGLPSLPRPHGPDQPAPIGCVGPSTMTCPPGTVRIPDPNDPYNPQEWPNDLPDVPGAASSSA